jgi:hypothetical protein
MEDTEYNQTAMKQFVEITKLYDKHRNQSIEKSLPELYKHVKKYF